MNDDYGTIWRDGSQNGKSREQKIALLKERPCYEIRAGVKGFRGVVLRQDEYNVLMATFNHDGELKRSLKSSLAYFWRTSDRNPNMSTTRRVQGIKPAYTYAFRHGFQEARGIAMSERVFEDVLLRVEVPTIQTQVFETTTQALIFCEQAGTPLEDWRTLEDSVLLLGSQFPVYRVPEMFRNYIMRHAYDRIPKGPAPAANAAMTTEIQGVRLNLSFLSETSDESSKGHSGRSTHDRRKDTADLTPPSPSPASSPPSSSDQVKVYHPDRD
ncbi:hypothetical protein FVE85_3674 [Porphyridium purpureum]|uniref:Uncharacterized protein n=1 Tax=Porphyridium purpureum TaxID=35688 RepID=A0A5J4YLD0_PORPP|nr:hypothetical protein FVE85_3674 [Porphyridium purpureum]|eukprot:POR9424..scf249_10